MATITAGWQEREAEDLELQEFLGQRCINLRLHARSDDVYQKDPEFFAAHRAKQDTQRHLQGLYRHRLVHALEAVRELNRASAPAALVDEEREAAISALRLVDEQHLHRTQEIQSEFEHEYRPATRSAIEHHYRELRAVLGDCFALLIAGGHVASLLNRMRLFQLDTLLTSLPRPLPIFAWSAGAMAITERVVLFHDSPPQGPGNAELLGEGLGLVPGTVVLPHASRRLQLEDTERVSIFARRFAPQRCLTLDQGERLVYSGRSFTGNARQLHPSGSVEPIDSEAP